MDIKLCRDVATKRDWYLATGWGYGADFHPPGHPAKWFGYVEATYRRKAIALYGLDTIGKAHPEVIQADAAKRLADGAWRAPLNTAANFLWICQVFGAFGVDVANPPPNSMRGVLRYASPAVAWVQGFYPEFRPEPEHWQGAHRVGQLTPAFATAWASYVARGASHVG